MSCYLLLENGDRLILEDGSGFLLLEVCNDVPAFQVLGGGLSDKAWRKHYEDLYEQRVRDQFLSAHKKKEQNDSAIVDAEEKIIDLKLGVQDLLLQKRQAERARHINEQKQITALTAHIEFLLEKLASEEKRLLDLQNQNALIAIVLAYPFMNINIGGAMTIN